MQMTDDFLEKEKKKKKKKKTLMAVRGPAPNVIKSSTFHEIDHTCSSPKETILHSGEGKKQSRCVCFRLLFRFFERRKINGACPCLRLIGLPRAVRRIHADR